MCCCSSPLRCPPPKHIFLNNKKKHSHGIWVVGWRIPKGFFISTSFRGCTREIANALESGLVTPKIFQEVETFIIKFPMAEVLTCPEDKLTIGHQVSPRDLRGDFSVSWLRGLEVCCSGQQDAMWCWKETEVLVQVHGEAAVLGCLSGVLEKWAGSEMPWSHWF